MSSKTTQTESALPSRAIRAAAGEEAVRLAHRANGALRRAEVVLATAQAAEQGDDPAAWRDARRRALAEAEALQRLSDQLTEARRQVADALTMTSRALAASNAYRGCEHKGAAR